MTAKSHPPEPKRIKVFRFGLAKQIPKFPNNRASLHALEAKSLGSILIDYANWAIRYIAPRPRTVHVEITAMRDVRWKTLNTEIEKVLQLVRGGNDLTPYLSLQPHTRGFTPASSAKGPGVDRWADKDFLLNVMGYHHLHLDAAPGTKMRSDDVLFARVTRGGFTVVGIFNHTVFEATPATAVMTKERERLWEIFDEHSTRDVRPGSFVIPALISTSGHSMYFTQLAMNYARLIQAQDPNIDKLEFREDMYKRMNLAMPPKPKLAWHLHYLDLGLLDVDANAFWAFRNGPN